MKKFPILFVLIFLCSCAIKPVSYYISEDYFNEETEKSKNLIEENNKKIEALEYDRYVKNTIDLTKIQEFEDSLEALKIEKSILVDSLNADLRYDITGETDDYSNLRFYIDKLESNFNLFVEKKEQLNEELKLKQVQLVLDSNTSYVFKDNEEGVENSGLFISSDVSLIRSDIEYLKLLEKRITFLNIKKLVQDVTNNKSGLIFLEKNPKNGNTYLEADSSIKMSYEQNNDKSSLNLNVESDENNQESEDNNTAQKQTNIFIKKLYEDINKSRDFPVLDVNSNIMVLLGLTSQKLEESDIPELNKKIKANNVYVYIEPNFYYTDGNIGNYQALKRFKSFKVPAKYNYNETFLVTGGLPEKGNFNDTGIILKLKSVERPKIGSKKHLIFDFVGYYNFKEEKSLIYDEHYLYDVKNNPVIYANNNTFGSFNITNTEKQNLTTAYNFSLSMLEFPIILNSLSYINSDLKSETKGLNDAYKGKASTLVKLYRYSY